MEKRKRKFDEMDLMKIIVFSTTILGLIALVFADIEPASSYNKEEHIRCQYQRN